MLDDWVMYLPGQQPDDMGRMAVRTVLALARGEAPDSRHIELATELVVRGSTAPPRDDVGQLPGTVA